MNVRFLLSLRNVEGLLFMRGIDVCHDTARLWRNPFGPLCAANIKRQRPSRATSVGRTDYCTPTDHNTKSVCPM